MPTRSEGLLQLDRVELLALLDPLSYGTLLGQGVLSRGVRDTFVRARAGGETVHVLLFVEAPELRDLRWERLCAPLDDDRWDFLARDPRVPLSIHLPTATDRRFPPCGRADMRALVPGVYRIEVMDGEACRDLGGLDLLDVSDGAQHGGCRGAAVAEVKHPVAAVLSPRRLVLVRGPRGVRRVAVSDKMHHVLEGFARARQDDDERQDSSDAAEPNHLETVSQRRCRPPARR